MAMSVTFFCIKYLETAQRICTKFTRKMCLVAHSDDFQGQGQFWRPECGLCLEKTSLL